MGRDEEYSTPERVKVIVAKLRLLGHPQPMLWKRPYVEATEQDQRDYWPTFRAYVLGRISEDAHT